MRVICSLMCYQRTKHNPSDGDKVNSKARGFGRALLCVWFGVLDRLLSEYPREHHENPVSQPIQQENGDHRREIQATEFGNRAPDWREDGFGYIP